MLRIENASVTSAMIIAGKNAKPRDEDEAEAGHHRERVTIHRPEIEAAHFGIHHRHDDDHARGKARDEKGEEDDDQPPEEGH